MYEIALPMRSPFRSALTEVGDRHTFLVSIGRDGVAGWGEAAPIAGGTVDDHDTVRTALRMWAGSGEAPPSPTAQAAIDQATTDLEARCDREALWQRLGGLAGSIPASVAIGLGSDDEILTSVAHADAAGVGRLKLKIAPGRSVTVLQLVRARYPHLTCAVDANGTFGRDDIAELIELDSLRPSYIEQPLPPGDIDGHRIIRKRLSSPICLDEAIDGPDAVAAAADAADIVTVKPGRLGTTGAVATYAAAVASGLAVKVSGLIESGVGRAHVIAVATLPGVSEYDMAPSGWYFDADVVVVTDAGLVPSPRPGIGVEPDPDLLQRRTVARFGG